MTGHDDTTGIEPRVRVLTAVRAVRARRLSPAIVLLAGLIALAVLAAVAVGSGSVQLGSGGTGSFGGLGAPDTSSPTYGYYHERSYDWEHTGDQRWDVDSRSRAGDPRESVLGNTTRWEYDGPYSYGPYGSEGIRLRGRGGIAADAAADGTGPEPLEDVFTAWGDTDPSGGQPIGVAPSALTNPYYDPYGGYSNPYANRIRLAYGEGYGAGTLRERTGP